MVKFRRSRHHRRRTYHHLKPARRQISPMQLIGFGLIFATIVVVTFATLIFIYFNSNQIVENRLHYLVKAYYEDYYYNNLTENGTNADVLANYTEYGLPTVKLSQLLTFNNHQYADFEKYFTNDRYTCDSVTTSAKIFPVAPYGPTDYTVNYRYSCSHFQSPSTNS